MTGTYLIRSVGVLTCMAVIATGWNAEAGWRRHHHRRSVCCEPVCCEPVCCEPVCWEPVRETVCCEPVRETVCCDTVIVAPVRTCCTDSFVMTESAASSSHVSVAKTSASLGSAAPRGTTAASVSLKR